jgi:signal transduction histidine kinase
MSFSNIQRKTDSITTEMKSVFIQTFTNNEIYRDLQTGSVFYYTQHLGDSLTKALRQEKVNMQNLTSLYRRTLAEYDIDNAFLLNTGSNKVDPKTFPYQTRIYRSGPPYPEVLVSASFNNPNLIILNRMKAVLISSLLLITIIIFCFFYSVKTLLSQKKLADLKADFINNMTHELKTPVATISIAAEAIQDFKLNTTSSDEYLSIIRQQAGKLTALIDQILKSMVNEQTAIELKLEPVCLTELLDNCIRQYQPQLRQRNMETSLISGNASVVVNGDPVHLCNVMANLLDNAIKYGSADSVIEIKIKADDGNAIIQVINKGTDIPFEYKDKIFDKFFRVPTGNIHNVKGYGLGLSYVQNIIRQHGGIVSMSSAASKTSFTLQLPITQHDISESIIT